MNPFNDIAIEVVDNQQVDHALSDNIKAILYEINALQEKFVRQGVRGVVDLRNLPLLPGEYDTLKHILGEGEVDATLSTLGASRIIETSLTGVWWIFHNDENNDRLAEFIEITDIPEILKSNKHETEMAYTVLKQQLENS